MKTSNTVRLQHLASVIFTGILIFIIIIYLHVSGITNLLTKLDLEFFIIFIFLIIIALILRSARWYILLRAAHQEPSMKIAFEAIVLSRALNSIFPARIGELSRLYLSKKKIQIDYIAATGSIVVENYLDLIFLCLIGYASVLLTMRQQSIPKEVLEILYWILILLIILIVGLLVLIFIGKQHPHLSKLISLRIYQFIEKSYNSFYLLLKSLVLHPKIFSLSSFLTLIILLIESSLVFTVGKVMDIPGPYSVFLLAALCGTITYALVITPGNFGTYEGVVASVLYLIEGIDPRIGILIALTVHSIETIILLLISSLIVFFEGINISTILNKKYPTD